MARVLVILVLLCGCIGLEPVSEEASDGPQGGDVEVDLVTRASEPPELFVEILSPEDGAVVPPGFSVDMYGGPIWAIDALELYIDGDLVGSDTRTPVTFITPDSVAEGTRVIEGRIVYQSMEATTQIRVTVKASASTGDAGPEGPGGGSDNTDSSDRTDGGTNNRNDHDRERGDGAGPSLVGCSAAPHPNGAAPHWASLLLLSLPILLRRSRASA